MRIAVCGTSNQGKSTYIGNFIKEWPMYKRSGDTYRKAIKELSLPINKKTTKQSQRMILECLNQDMEAGHKEKYVIFDRSTLDNLVYSLRALGSGQSDLDAAFIKETVEVLKDSMRFIDIIFFLPITKFSPVNAEPKEFRDVDQIFRVEVDNIFKAIAMQHLQGKSEFFHKDDAPPIIEIFGNPLERIEMTKLYVNKYGDCLDTVSSILSNENIDLMEKLLSEQRDAGVDEKALDVLKNTIIKAKTMQEAQLTGNLSKSSKTK
jgi:hypothetical protein